MSTSTLTSRLSIIHAAMLTGSLILEQYAQQHRPPPVSLALGFGSKLWLCGVVAWPLWYVIVLSVSRGQRWQAVGALAIGTVLWVYPALLVLGILLMSLGHGC